MSVQNWDRLEEWRGQADSGYAEAQRYYQSLRNEFLKQALDIQNEITERQAENFIEDLNKEFLDNKDSLIKEYDPDMEKLYETVADAFEAMLVDPETNADEILREAQNIVSNTKDTAILDTYIKKIKQDINLYDQNYSHIQSIMKDLFKDFFGQTATRAGLQGMMGMLRRVILERTVFNNNKIREEIHKSSRMGGYKKLFNGYYEEVLKTKIINKFSGSNGLIKGKLKAIQAGDIPDSKGVDSEYDIIMHFSKTNNLGDKKIQGLINSMNEIQGTYNIEASVDLINGSRARQGYGIQSKLWLLPEKNEAGIYEIPNQFYSIGSREKLHNSLGGGVLTTEGEYDETWKRGWSYNILLLSRNLTKVFGLSQVMYGVRNGFIWTSDLIQRMRAANLYVSFYYKREKGKFFYPSTSEVVWDRSRLGYKNKMMAKARKNKKSS